MNRESALARAAIARRAHITMGQCGTVEEHASISAAKRFVREQGLRCVAERAKENLFAYMEDRIAKEKAEAERIAAEKSAS